MDKAALFDYLKSQVANSNEPHEAQRIAGMLGEYLLEAHPDTRLALADQLIERIVQGEPVQYVIGYTWFYNLKLEVNSYVLIPRPETEELVDWLVQDVRKGLISNEPDILDVGTGSGCIALALKKQIPGSDITGVDISYEALALAMSNAVANNLMVQFRQYDFLNESPDNLYDAIISNPPYVSQEEYQQISSTVRDFEPLIALTPLSEDPLVFYRVLAEYGRAHLKPNGRMYLELNEFHAEEIRALFIEAEYTTDMREDMQGKWRMLKAGRGISDLGMRISEGEK